MFLSFLYCFGIPEERAKKNRNSYSACTFLRVVLASYVLFKVIIKSRLRSFLFFPLLVIKAIKIVGSLYAV